MPREDRPELEPLARLLSGGAPLPVARALRLAAGILDALVARDAPYLRLAPDRVLIGAGDAVELVEPPPGEQAPEYLAPEQALAGAVDAAGDVFVAGAILYEMVAGRRPFEGKTRGESISALLVRDPRPLAGVPPELDAVLRRALAKRAGDRWPTPAAMRDALQAVAVPAPEPAPDPVAPADPAPPHATVRLPAPSPAAPEAAALPPRHPRLALALGLGFIVLIAAWFTLRPRTPGATAGAPGAAPAALAERVRASLERGELAAARAQAEALAKAYPSDARAFALLGHVLFAQGDKERALAAYREAFHLDASIGASPELLANLRATFADRVHGEAAFRLTEEIGTPAEPILSDLAAHTNEARLKRRAAEAIGRIAHGEKTP